MSDFINRIRDHLPGACGCRIKPAPSIGDRLLANAERLTIDIYRCHNGMTELEFSLKGSFSSGGEDEDADVLDHLDPAELQRFAVGLLGEFTTRREGGAA